MGTPKKVSVRKSLEAPTVAEKIRLLAAGKEEGQKLSIDSLSTILEEVKEILLPLVEWLDKPLFSEEQFVPASMENFRKKRGMRLFEASFMSIWLERSGQWFARTYNPPKEEALYYEVDSAGFAALMASKSDDFLDLSLRDGRFLKEIAFLKDIALYDALVLHVLSLFFESVEDSIKEREQRFCVMKERLNLLKDFTDSLDPLVSQGRTLIMKAYSIFNDHGHGTSRYTADYLCQKALDQFWGCIDKRHSTRLGYHEQVSEYGFASLRQILEQVGYLSEKIKGAADSGKTNTNSLFGFSSSRLPFTEEELDILKKVVESIRV